jgi:hypothetical protein
VKPAELKVALATPAEPSTVRTEVVEAMLLHLDGGEATVQRGGSGDFVALKIGDAIREGDVVRTGEGTTLELDVATKSVVLSERSSLTFSILGAKRLHAEVMGHVMASNSGEGSIELAAIGSDAMASTDHGKMAFIVDGRGRAVATALEGSGRFSGGGRGEALKEGQMSTLGRSNLPSRPVSMPRHISLKVSWPAGSATNRSELTLRGVASPTSRVWVQGQPIDTGLDGTFVTRVTLKRGKQPVTVRALDALGRRATDTRQVLFDPDIPSIQGQVLYR